MLLLLYTGQRRSDVVQMKWSQFDGEIIEVAQQQKTGEYVAIPCHHWLRAALSTLPRHSEYILTGERGTPYHPESLAHAVRRQLHAIGIHGYSVHGLRKNAAKALAEAGCPLSEIMAGRIGSPMFKARSPLTHLMAVQTTHQSKIRTPIAN